MRAYSALFGVLLAGLGGASAFAQGDEINPRLLGQQIHEQQKLVESAEGKRSGDAWLKLAVLLQDGAQYGASEAAYQRTLELMAPRGRAALADVQDHMATMYMESGQLNKAELLEREALRCREAENDAIGTGVSHMHLAALLLREGEARRAEAEARIAVGLLVPEKAGGVERSAVTPEEKMTALINLSLVRCELKACAAAIPDLRLALTIARKNYADDTLPVGYIEFLLGYTFWQNGDLEHAAPYMRRGIQELAAAVGSEHPLYARTLTQYRDFLVQAGPAAEAKRVEAELEGLRSSAEVARAEAHAR